MNQINTSLKIVAYLIYIFGLFLGILFNLNILFNQLDLLDLEKSFFLLNTFKNPFIVLMIGLLVAALLQSNGGVFLLSLMLYTYNFLNIRAVIFLIIGISVGSALTSILISFRFAHNTKEFRKAIIGATLHDLFYIITSILVFVIELFTNVFSDFLLLLANNSTNDFHIFLKETSKHLVLFLESQIYIPIYIQSIFFLILFIILFKILQKETALFIIYILKNIDFGNIKREIKLLFFGGLISTLAQFHKQYSNGLLVSLTQKKELKKERVLIFLGGAFLSAVFFILFSSIFYFNQGLQIIIFLLLFHSIGLVIFFVFNFLCGFVLFVARHFERNTIEMTWYSVAYFTLTFFFIPFLLIFFSVDKNYSKEQLLKKEYKQKPLKKTSHSLEDIIKNKTSSKK